MFQSAWGLQQPPFPSGIDTRLFYEGASQRESLARLRFLANNGRRLGLLLGEPGLGKSLLLKVFAKECRQQGRRIAQIDLLGLSSREFYWKLGTELQAAVRVEDDLVRLFRQIADHVQANRLQDISTVILLDQAHQAGPDLLKQVLRLTHLEAAAGWLTFILATDLSQVERLGQGLLEQIDLRIDLEPWDELDTTGYLQLALIEAGSERPLYEDQALSEIHRLANGVPRRVNRLANCALLAGSTADAEIVTAETVQSAHEALRRSLPSLARPA